MNFDLFSGNRFAERSELLLAGKDKGRSASLSKLEKNVDCFDDSNRCQSHGNLRRTNDDDDGIVVARKDAIYQGSLRHIPLFNLDANEYHKQMISRQINEDENKSFFSKIGEQIDLRLLGNASFALFAVSNFLTSLGFNVPYNFANDLAADANVLHNRRHWIIMSIGISNCFGRVIIGFLADRSWVNDRVKRIFLA